MQNNNEKKSTVESWHWVDGVLVSHEIKDLELEWKSEKDDPIFQTMQENISIGFLNPMYIEVNAIQDKNDEYKKIKKFLNKFFDYYVQKNNLNLEDLKLEFINYGKTELVYVLTSKNNNRVTLLVKQPAVEFGKVKQEANNLIELQQIDEMVVAPIDYFRLGDQELYVTPYINQARCIASYGSWGMYVPEPYYRFESFTTEQEKVVNTCMIAKLVSFYDFQKQEGIGACKLGGGAFMLLKGWEWEKPSIENTLNSLYFIAAREKVNCSFEDYLQLIRSEFSRVTINENYEKLIINHRGRVPMKMEDIEEGIILGKVIIKEKEGTITKKMTIF